MDVLILLARLVLAGVFLVSGIAKLFDLAGSQKAMREFGLPEPLARLAGIGLPIAELAVAILLLPSLTAPWAAWGAVALLAGFIGGISYNLARGNTPDCHCFGQLQSEPIGPSTLIRNGVLLAVALFIGVAGFSYGPGPGIFEWSQNMTGLAWVVLVGGVIILAALAGVVWMLVHLLGQNGRLLVRLDKIEEALADADIAIAGDEDDEEAFEEGLPFGSPAPPFSLTGLHGEQMTLAALRATGNQVLLIFTDPNCGPCNALLPDVGTWQREHRSKLSVALISRGKPEAYLAKSAEHGLSNILLQENNEVADAYQVAGTPTGLLVRADGTIASGLAPGGDAIRRLVTQAVENKVAIPLRPAARPAPPRAAPAPMPLAGSEKIGSPAPEVSLPNLTGETVTLAEFKGEPTAVLFWNPGCGFCQRMLPELKAWEESPPEGAPKLLVVSTGEAERNAEMGLKSPVVLDGGFNTGRAFGASGTPSALLINAEGEIATGIAVGAPGVLGLLRGDTPAPLIFEDNEDEDAEPEGPPVGSPAPAVRLPDPDGNLVDLADHQGTRTMLLFWNPDCGFCQRMLPDIKKWEQKPPKGAPKLVLISAGSADENRAQGLRSLTLLDDDFSVGNDFGSDGTPSAIMIDAQGRIASSLVVGAPEVMKLAKTTRDPALPKPTTV